MFRTGVICLIFVCLGLLHKEVNGNRFFDSYKYDRLSLSEGSRLSKLKNGVLRWSQEESVSLKSLIRSRPLIPLVAAKKVSNVGDPFKWESCGPENQLMDIHNLTIKPSPLSFPGKITFGFNVQFHDTILNNSSLSADLVLSANARGTWIKLPCISGIGSCKYDDLCHLLEKLQCPPEFQQQDIPCKCPFTKGTYKMSSYSVQVLAEVFFPANYEGVLKLSTKEGGQLACYKLFFTIA